LDPRKPPDRLDADRADWVSDLVAFANAQGGHIIVGIEADDQDCASRLRPMNGDDAKRLADTLRDTVIAHIKPNIIQLEIRSFEITTVEWIVIAGIPRSSQKPHMSSMHHGTRFTVRDGSQVEEIKAQVESIHSGLDRLEQALRKTE
jgi:predicted HTH transcriptional regulator